jgi:hypothetical protein
MGADAKHPASPLGADGTGAAGDGFRDLLLVFAKGLVKVPERCGDGQEGLVEVPDGLSGFKESFA